MRGAESPLPSSGGGTTLQVVPWEGFPGEWDALLDRFDHSTFCHLAGWQAVMSQTLGHTLHYKVAVDPAGEVNGMLPLVRVRSRIFGDYLVSMPFLSYGGPLGTEEARRLLGEAAAQEAKELGVDLLELRSRTPVPGDLRTSHRKLTVLLDLPESSRDLWEKGLKAKVRSQVRRPQKDGMEAQVGKGEVGRFYGVFSRAMRDLGTPVLPRGFFAAVAEELSECVVFCTVHLGDEPVAAGCGFFWKGEFEITWAGSLREYNRSAPNMLLYWSLMEEAIELGARTFNFGRCSAGSGTHRFKRQWGGTDHPLPWAQWSPGSLSATPTPSGKKYELATAIWRRIPLGLANSLGPVISRNIP